VYYRCTRSRGKCHELPVREDELASATGVPFDDDAGTRNRVVGVRNPASSLSTRHRVFRTSQRDAGYFKSNIFLTCEYDPAVSR
jgi:hypothetical protein